MKIKGTWKGKYYFEKLAGVQEAPPPVSFVVKINWQWFGRFWGTVEDNEEEGGMYGIGRVKGIIRNEEIAFVKRMPYLGLVGENGGMEYVEDIPHPSICYEGNINSALDEIVGRWTIKMNTVNIYGELVLIPETTGTFYMRKKR